ncbi:tRNA-splicing endonuclease subunit sen54 [Malassezia sp. CBS 17886]|nr:tRNA-splicing endonuclease subunit sen54 [Malassezia sp. CBS 17886]
MEDEAPHASRRAPGAESDEEEDMPDYQALAALYEKRAAQGPGVERDAGPAIPKRGEKDFEPTGFGGQARVLERSRDALLTTIAMQRAHSSKSLSTATWDPVLARAFVHTQRGQSCTNMGVTERRTAADGRTLSCLELFPEEATYLVERGSLDCRWTRTPGVPPADADFTTCLPMSVEQAYAQVLGHDACTPARYQIYAYLKRLGYIVQRAHVTDRMRAAQGAAVSAAAPRPRAPTTRLLAARLLSMVAALLWRLWAPIRWMLRIVHRRLGARAPPRGLLGVSPTDSYDDVFRALQIVHSDHGAAARPPQAHASLEPFFYAWRPATHFKRTHPPPPEFRICVLETDKTPMLGARDFEELFSHVPVPAHVPGMAPGPAPPGMAGDERELQAIREANRRAYGKPAGAGNRRVPHAAPRSTAPAHTTWIGAALRPLLCMVRMIAAWLQRGAARCGLHRRTRKRAHAPPNVYLPLKAGRRSVVVAIVDQGTMSLLRFGEAEFARWRIAGGPMHYVGAGGTKMGGTG